MTENYERRNLIDRARSAGLADVGLGTHDAATIIDHNGVAHLALIRRSDIGNLTSVFDESCSGVAHEQLGEWRIPEPAKPTDPPTDLGRRVMRWPDNQER